MNEFFTNSTSSDPRITINSGNIINGSLVSGSFSGPNSFLHLEKRNPTAQSDSLLGFEEANNVLRVSRRQMLVDEEDGTFLKAFRNLVAMATEAREEQKRRVILRQWDDEEW